LYAWKGLHDIFEENNVLRVFDVITASFETNNFREN
jgi:hypothetical protein